MRSIDPNFITNSRLATKDLLSDEREKGETSHCPECGQEFWVKWYVGVKWTKYCAKCFFKVNK